MPVPIKYGAHIWVAYLVLGVVVLFGVGVIAFCVSRFRYLRWLMRCVVSAGMLFFAGLTVLWYFIMFRFELFLPHFNGSDECGATPMRWWTLGTVVPGATLDGGTASCWYLSWRVIGVTTGVVLLVGLLLLLVVWLGARKRRTQRLETAE